MVKVHQRAPNLGKMMNKTISLEEFIEKLEICNLLTIGYSPARSFGFKSESEYLDLFLEEEMLRFNKVDNQSIPVFNREDGTFSYANLITDSGRTLNVSLFSYMQL